MEASERIKQIQRMLRKEQEAARRPGAKPYGQRSKVINLNAELDRLQRRLETT